MFVKIFRLLSKKIFTLVGLLTIGDRQERFFCGGYCRFTKNTVVGNNVNFNGMKIRGGGNVRIGENFHSGTDCEIITQNHNFEGEKIPYDSKYVYKDINIGDNVWLGNRVIILPGVFIGEGAIIQAGSVVVSNVPACAIAGGHPAKVFANRDKKHYYELKGKGLVH